MTSSQANFADPQTESQILALHNKNPIKITPAPKNASWMGAQMMTEKSDFSQSGISNEQYFEEGPDRIFTHLA